MTHDQITQILDNHLDCDGNVMITGTDQAAAEIMKLMQGEMVTEMQAKHLLCYGNAGHLKLDDDKRKLDWALEFAFDLLGKHTVMDADSAKDVFWSRITALANFTPFTPKSTDQ